MGEINGNVQAVLPNECLEQLNSFLAIYKASMSENMEWTKRENVKIFVLSVEQFISEEKPLMLEHFAGHAHTHVAPDGTVYTHFHK